MELKQVVLPEMPAITSEHIGTAQEVFAKLHVTKEEADRFFAAAELEWRISVMRGGGGLMSRETFDRYSCVERKGK